MKILWLGMLFLLIVNIMAAQTPLAGYSVLPTCKRSKGKKLITWPGGKFGLKFSIPTHDFEVRGGKLDVDYVLYRVSPKKSTTVLQLWFGGNTLSLSPSSQKLESSTNLTKSEFTVEDRSHKGVDVRGRSIDGSYWRHFAIEYQGGAVYDTKDKREADRLDRLVDSACYTPYLKD